MTDRLEQASSLVRRLEVPWDAAQVERSLTRLRRRRRRRRLVRGGLALVLVLLGATALSARLLGSAEVSPDLPRQEPWLRLPDGSVARLSSPDIARVVESTPTSVTVELAEGRATFDVVHRATRAFVVRVGSVAVIDLGTVFTIERRAGRVHVAVETGRVRVEAPTETAELEAGESRWFSEQPAPALPREPKSAAAAPPSGVPKEARPSQAPSPPAGKPPAAATLQREAGPAVDAGQPHSHEDEVEQLLRAADALRRAGRGGEAAPLLEQVVSGHPSDERAPMAAFTLGKLQLEAGRPREAADAFVTVRRLAPRGALVEDALGRELEAAAAAGDVPRARSVAGEYLLRFPAGARAEAARRALAPP